MKKVLSVILALVMLLSVCPMAFAAESETSDCPYVLVPGYSFSSLYKVDEQGNESHVWGIDMNEIMTKVLENIVEVGVGIGELTKGNAKKIAEVVGREMYNMLYDMACNDDGSSAYDVRRYLSEPEDCCFKTLQEKYPDGKFQTEVPFLTQLSETVGKENIYIFNTDFRMGAVFCAGQLDEFVDKLCDYTGKDKVNIIAVSHGGQVSGTYLTLYGHKHKVNNAVLTVPALGGAGLAYDILKAEPDFNEELLLKFIEHGFVHETDYDWLVRANELGFLDDIIENLIPYVLKILGNWGSIWDFAPTKYYEELKAERLDPVKNAELIKKSDYMHYEVMPKFYESFKKLNNEGSHISIIAGTDNMIVTGLKENSDAIITTEASTGATCAPFGMRFSDGYVQKNETGRYSVSPAMTIDASTAYLPDNTWFVEGLFHGMTFNDDYSNALAKTLLTTDKIKDITTDPAFPQFHATTNASHDVFAAFNNSTEGYLSSDDNALVITNISKEHSLKLLAVSAKGIDLKFSSLTTKTLKPGESVSVEFRGAVPRLSLRNINIVVDYCLVGSVTPLSERVFNFTVLNGKALKYDESKPYTEAMAFDSSESVLPDDANNAHEQFGIKDFVDMVYNVLTTWLSDLVKFIKSFIPVK